MTSLLAEFAQLLIASLDPLVELRFADAIAGVLLQRMDLRDAGTVLARLPAAFEHFNEVHPHSSLKMKSPREFRQHQQRVAQARNHALHCA